MRHRYGIGKHYTLEELINLIVELACSTESCIDLETEDGCGCIECYSDGNGRGEFILIYENYHCSDSWRTTDIGRPSIEKEYDELKENPDFKDRWVFMHPGSILQGLESCFKESESKVQFFKSAFEHLDPSMEDYVNLYWSILEPDADGRSERIAAGLRSDTLSERLWHVHCVATYAGDTWVRAKTYNEAYRKAKDLDIQCEEWIDDELDIEEEMDDVSEDMIQS